MNYKFLIKAAVGVIIGAALMFVLNCFAAIPIGVEGTSLPPGYGVLAAGAAIFGPVAGFLIGFIGHTLVDFSNVLAGNEPHIWWSWVIASGVCGCAIGLFCKYYRLEKFEFGIIECLIFNGVQIVTNILVWVFLARTLDMIIYNEPFGKVTLQGFAAAGANIAAMLVLGSLIIFGYSQIMARMGKKEE